MPNLYPDLVQVEKQGERSKKILQIILLVLLIITNVVAAYSLEKIADALRQPQAADSGCDKTGVNMAIVFSEAGDAKHAIDTAANMGMVWLEGYADMSDQFREPAKYEVARLMSYAQSQGLKVILRFICPGGGDNCLGNGDRDLDTKDIAKYIKDLTDLGVGEFYLVAGHNEPNCTEYEDPKYEREFVLNLIKNIDNSKVKFLSPEIDVQCGNRYYGDYLEQMGLDLLEHRKIEGVAVSAYDTTVNQAYQVSKDFLDWLELKEIDTPIYVTETGMIDRNLSLFKENYRLLLEEPKIKNAIIFNAFMNNPEFDYHQEFTKSGVLKSVSSCFKGDVTPPPGGGEPSPTEPTTVPSPTPSPPAEPGPEDPSPEPKDGDGTPVLPTEPSQYSCSKIKLVSRIQYWKQDSSEPGSLYGYDGSDKPVKFPAYGEDIDDIHTLRAVGADSWTGQGLESKGITVNVIGAGIHKYLVNSSVLDITDFTGFTKDEKYIVTVTMLDKDQKTCQATTSFTYVGEDKSQPGDLDPVKIPSEVIPNLKEYEAYTGLPIVITIGKNYTHRRIKNFKITSKPAWLTATDDVLQGTPTTEDIGQSQIDYQYKTENISSTHNEFIKIEVKPDPGYQLITISSKLQKAEEHNNPKIGVAFGNESEPFLKTAWFSTNDDGIGFIPVSKDLNYTKIGIKPHNYLSQNVAATIQDSQVNYPQEFTFGDIEIDKTMDSVVLEDYSLFLAIYSKSGTVSDGNKDGSLWAIDRWYMTNNFNKKAD